MSRDNWIRRGEHVPSGSPKSWKSQNYAAVDTCTSPAKNTEAKYLPDIRQVPGSGSLLTDRESLRAIRRSASWLVIRLRNFHPRSRYNEDGLQLGTSHFSYSSCIETPLV